MPKRKQSGRLDLIRELNNHIAQVTFEDKYSELSHLDVIQALNGNISDSLRWQRRSSGYRKLKKEDLDDRET